MVCNKCGSQNNDGVKYCTSCGNEIKNSNQINEFNNPMNYGINNGIDNNQVQNSSSINNQSFNNNSQINNINQNFNNNSQINGNNNQNLNNNLNQTNLNYNYQNNTNNQYMNSQMIMKNNQKKYGTISLILGIVSLVLSLFINILALPISITGVVFGIKGKKSGTAGLILNIISIIIPIAFIIFFMGLFVQIFNNINYIGEYKCGSYYGNMKAEDFKQNVDFALNKDKKFSMIYKETSNSVRIEGTYEISEAQSSETDNTMEYIINLNATSRVFGEKKLTDPYSTRYSLVIKSDGNAVLMNTISQNMYMCRKVK